MRNINEVVTEDIKKEILEDLKGRKWAKKDYRLYLCTEFIDPLFYKVSASLDELGLTSKILVWYEQTEEQSYKLTFVFYVEEKECYNDFLLFASDVLGLFTKKDETEPVDTVEEKDLDKMLPVIQSKNTDEVMDFLKQNCVDLWNAIVCDVVNLLTVADVEANESLYDDIKSHIVENEIDADDLTDDLKDEVCKEWLENNIDELKHLFLDNASSYELKEMATDIIKDYL